MIDNWFKHFFAKAIESEAWEQKVNPEQKLMITTIQAFTDELRQVRKDLLNCQAALPVLRSEIRTLQEQLNEIEYEKGH